VNENLPNQGFGIKKMERDPAKVFLPNPLKSQRRKILPAKELICPKTFKK